MAKKRGKKHEPEGQAGKREAFDGFRPLAGLRELKDRLEAEKAAEAQRAQAAKSGKADASTKGKPSQATTSSTAARARADRAANAANVTSGDDDLDFHRMMSGVTPLSSDKTRVPVHNEVRAGNAKARAAEAKAKVRAETDAVLDHLHRLVDDVARFEVIDDGRRVEGRRVDTPPNVVRTLRRGLLPIDARLDLHGFTASEARDKLLDFLRDTRARGERCVLVIHGKGERVPGAGVLRGEIGAWLSQGRAREHVAAFATATNEDGGEGAVYVALRR